MAAAWCSELVALFLLPLAELAGLFLLPLAIVAPRAGVARGAEPLSLDRDLAAAAAARPLEQDPRDFRVYWDRGLRFETVDKSVKFKLGGRVHNDYTWQTADGELGDTFDFEDGVEFRRARIHAGGELDGLFQWFAAYDFADGGVAIFRDAYVGYLPGDYRVRVGQYKQHFSIEWLSSSNAISFMERGSLNQAIVNRGVGASIENGSDSEGLVWGAGFYREADEQGLDLGDGAYSMTARLAGAPVYEGGGERVVHVGGAASFRGMDEFRARSRYEQGLAPLTIDTPAIAVENALLLGLELAWVHGPWSFQAEAVAENVRARSGPDPEVRGWYAFVSRFLTDGDRRRYKRSAGTFAQVAPRRPLGEEGGKGAVELALRYSSLRFDDVTALVGGDDYQHAATLGLNWYQNYHTRLMLNLVAGEQDDLDGRYMAIGLRFQFFF